MKTMMAWVASLFLLTACNQQKLEPGKPVHVKIETTMGNVTVLLYDDTPLHRDNFIRLCQEGTEDGVLFHRIIREFVVQGGDPASKAHEPGVLYGDGDGGYTVPAEIRANHFNKRGALIDAKESDEVNPERASAGTQFCFIQGKVWEDEELDQMEERINNTRRNWLYYKFVKRLKQQDKSLATPEKAAELHMQASLMVEDTLATLAPMEIPAAHREVYKTQGGSPHLDGSVTVFGEVIEGLDVVEKMSEVETDKNDRPLKDVIVLSTKVFNP